MGKNGMKIGYSFWGFLSDYKIKDGKEISSPDGNATYSYALIHELLKQNHEVWFMQPDRDFESVKLYGKDAFKAFSQGKRFKVYQESKKFDLLNGDKFPDLDILLVEWRFQIPGRNCIDFYDDLSNFDTTKFQPDLYIQTKLLEHYKQTDTKIIFWDLDNKLTYNEEKFWCPDAIFETAINPMHQYIHRTSINAPCLIDDLLQFEIQDFNNEKELVYIGSRYERDDVIEEYIKPYSENRPNKVHFYGNWKTYPEKYKEVLQMWPNIKYNDRITTKDFHNVYKDAIAVPLLGKRQYFENGFITPRPAEAVMFGSVPIGFNEQLSDDRFSISVEDSYELMKAVDYLKYVDNRDYHRKLQVEMLEEHDASFLVNKIEEV